MCARSFSLKPPVRLDILARQRRRTAAGSVCFQASAVRTLRRSTAFDRHHRWHWPSAGETRAAISGPDRSCHKLSGQRMIRMTTKQASGWASALRVNLTSTTRFKTRLKPCRIAVRADHEECERFTENRKLKTENLPRSCTLLFPYATSPLQLHRATCTNAVSLRSNGSHRHQPTPLNLGRYSALSHGTREVKALIVMHHFVPTCHR